MERKKPPPDQPRRNNERQRRVPPYQQLAADIAQPLAGLQVPGASSEGTVPNEAGTSVDGRTENEMDIHQEQRDSQGRNQRQRSVPPYQQLAADMAQPLAELQVPGTNNTNREATIGVDNVDGRTENESESHQDASLGSKLEIPAERKRGRKHYLDLAVGMAGPLAELRVPGTSDERDLRREDGIQTRRQAEESLPHQESLSEYNPDATCGSMTEYESCGHSSLQLGTYSEGEIRNERGDRQQRSWSSEHEEAGKLPHQESLSEYNPDATCGSGYEYESYERSRLLFNSHSEDREMRSEQGNMQQSTESFIHQESLSEYNPDATCGSGFYRGESDIFTDYSNVQSESGSFIESNNLESSFMEGFSSKLPVETEADLDAACTKGGENKQLDSCYSQPDGEPSSKRTKRNPEVTDDQLSCDTETTSIGVAGFKPRDGSIPEVSSVESENFESIAKTQNQGHRLQNNGVNSGARNTECLSSEFEHMNLEDNNSVEASTVSDYSASPQSNQGIDLRGSTQESWKDVEDGSARFDDVSYTTSAERRERLHASSQMVGNGNFAGAVSGENVSTASGISQGARPKTTGEKVPKRKKQKTPKQSTKNAYTELAKEVAGDLSTMNRELGNSNAGNPRAANERSVARDQMMVDGRTVQAEKDNTSSLHSSPLEHEQRDTRQQSTLTSDVRGRGSGARDQTEDTLMLRDATQTADSNTHATSRHTDPASRHTRDTHEARSAAEYNRARVEEQQQLIDNMGPELQALVIEMVQRDEEELGGGHVLRGGYLNPPVPPREHSRRQEEGSDQGAQEASQQTAGKKSGKGKKKKGHYLELAGIIAPELAAVNTALMNGHGEEEPRQSRPDVRRTEVDHADGRSLGAVGHSPGQQPASVAINATGARLTEVRSRDQGVGVASRDHPRAHSSLPQSAANRRQRRGNGNRGEFSFH